VPGGAGGAAAPAPAGGAGGDTSAAKALAAAGLASTYDPNPSAPSAAATWRHRTPGSPSALEIGDIGAFLTTPVPRTAGIVQCFIERNKSGLGKKMYPVYQLFLKEEDRFLLAAKKRPKQKTSNYLISRSADDLDRDSESFLGKLRSNFVGTGLRCVRVL
jgi:tubby-related protein 1